MLYTSFYSLQWHIVKNITKALLQCFKCFLTYTKLEVLPCITIILCFQIKDSSGCGVQHVKC